ncbi:MAG: molybdopterin-dependent oxidoreductase [Proteobacteria bacterium]|nr:molybdopterin-dependent oxidoreductase [Pseudomonadota bacterium]
MQQFETHSRTSACPHDCPSGCSLEVQIESPARIGRITGDKRQTYTSGVICAKVARYAERVHHPDRLLYPMRRVGAKGEGRFERISWDAALDLIAASFASAAERHGAQSVWPYHSGGTMGQVQRYGMELFRNAFGYSRQHSTICSAPAEAGWRAGVGALRGVDPREMAESDLIVMWGGNPVSTQVNVMTHVTRARRTRTAKLVVVDVYRTPTVEQADVALVINPGTDGALALAIMCVLLRDGYADRDYLAQLTDFDAAVERHILSRTPEWAAPITGLDVAEIESFARLYGQTRRSFLRLGFGFTRSRNGAAAMHAVSCLPAMTGAWRERGGGALYMIWDREAWGFDPSFIHGHDLVDPKVRVLDQSRIGAVLTGEAEALKGGPPVKAMLMQNANSAEVAPGSAIVRRGLAREDLFLAVHEQFLTATARFADVVLPATTFLEHDDLYAAYGHTHLSFGPQLIEPAGEALSNFAVRCALAKRLGATDARFDMTAREQIDDALRRGGLGGLAAIAETGWLDRALPFEAAHFLGGFPNAGGRFRFKPDWTSIGPLGERMPAVADWMTDYERPDTEHPFKLVTPPARNFLNSTFTETQTSKEKERGGAPCVRMHPKAAETQGVEDGSLVRIGNRRGSVVLQATLDERQQRQTLVVEGVWPAGAFIEGRGINTLIGDDPVPPNGGVAFHDTAVWLRRC